MNAASPKDAKGAAKEKPRDSKKLNPEAHEDDDKDDVPKGLKKTKAGTARITRGQAEGTPLPHEDDDEEDSVEEDEDAEDREHGESARSSKDDYDEADAKERARYQRRLEFLIQEDEKRRQAKQDDDDEDDKDKGKEVFDNPEVANGEALAEGQAVGKAEAGSKEQSPKRQSAKTPGRPKTMNQEDEGEISPIVKKMVDEEVEKRLRAEQSVTRRLFQDEIDEEDAKRQYEESLKK